MKTATYEFIFKGTGNFDVTNMVMNAPITIQNLTRMKRLLRILSLSGDNYLNCDCPLPVMIEMLQDY